jgi:hypothetical protein
MSTISFTVRPENCTTTGEVYAVELYDPNDVTVYTDLPKLTACRVSWRGSEESVVVGSECRLQFFFEDGTGDVFNKLYNDMAGTAESLLYVRISRGVVPFVQTFWVGVVANDLTRSTWQECQVTLELTASDGFERLKVINPLPDNYGSLLEDNKVVGFMGALAFSLNQTPAAFMMESDFLFVSDVAKTGDAIGDEKTLQLGLFHPWEGLYYVTDDRGLEKPYTTYESLEKLLVWAGLRVYQYAGRFWVVADWAEDSLGFVVTKDYRESPFTDTPIDGSATPSQYLATTAYTYVMGANAWEGLSAAFSEVSIVDPAEFADFNLSDSVGLQEVYDETSPSTPETFNGSINLGFASQVGGATLKCQVYLKSTWRIEDPVNAPVYYSNYIDNASFSLKVDDGSTTYFWNGSAWTAASATITATSFGFKYTPGTGFLQTEVTINLLTGNIPAPPIAGDLQLDYTNVWSWNASAFTVTRLTLDEFYLISWELTAGPFRGIRYICNNVGDNQFSSYERTIDVPLWAYKDPDIGWHTYEQDTTKIPIITWLNWVYGAGELTYQQFVLLAYMVRAYMMSRTFEAELYVAPADTAKILAQIGGVTNVEAFPLNWGLDLLRGRTSGKWWTWRSSDPLEVEFTSEFV